MKVKFSRCSSNNLAGVPQVDGQLIYTKDTGDVYLDVGNQRHKVSNFIIENAKENISDPNLDKLYFISTESKLYKYLGEDSETLLPIWLDISGASEQYVLAKTQEAKDFADSQDTVVLTTANAYTDSSVENALNYADNVGSETLSNANEYTDIEVQGAKDYTDNKIGNINSILDEINGVEV